MIQACSFAITNVICLQWKYKLSFFKKIIACARKRTCDPSTTHLAYIIFAAFPLAV